MLFKAKCIEAVDTVRRYSCSILNKINYQIVSDRASNIKL